MICCTFLQKQTIEVLAVSKGNLQNKIDATKKWAFQEIVIDFNCIGRVRFGDESGPKLVPQAQKSPSLGSILLIILAPNSKELINYAKLVESSNFLWQMLNFIGEMGLTGLGCGRYIVYLLFPLPLSLLTVLFLTRQRFPPIVFLSLAIE